MRKKYLDNIRWITVVLVVIYHVLFMYNSVETRLTIGPFREVQYQDVYLYLVYPWFMLLLFVVSGISARYYLETHSHKEFIKSRTVKLLVPSTIGLFVFQWIQGYYSTAINNGFETMKDAPGIVKFFTMALSGQGVLWFAQLLWVFSLVLVLIRLIEKDKLYKLCAKANVIVIVLLTAVVYLSAQVLNVPMIEVFRCGIYGLGFLIGYFVFSHEEVMDRIERFWIPFSISAIVLAFAFAFCCWGQSYATYEVLDTLLCNVYAWIGVVAILSFMKKFGDVDNKFSNWMAKKSWGLYVFHYTVISACAYYLHIYSPQCPAIVCYMLCLISAFAGSYILYEVISRIPVIRWCVLGIRRSK